MGCHRLQKNAQNFRYPGVKVDIRNHKNRWKCEADLSDNQKANELRVNFKKTVKTTGIRINLVKMPQNSWPRIAQVTLFDSDNKPVIFNSRKDERPSPKEEIFDDSDWQKVTLPHDWAISEPFSGKLDHATGLLPWKGIGWYRKSFTVPASDSGRRIYLDFDGAMAHAKVYLNGKEAGGRPYGYSSFRVDLTPLVKFGKENLIAVHLDTEHWGSRWYPGAGIYRNVRLVKTAPVHVGYNGVTVTTPEVTKEHAVADFSITVVNRLPQAAPVTVSAVIHNPRGKIITIPSENISVAAGKSSNLHLTADITQPMLWNLAPPNLYQAEIIVKSGSSAPDRYPVTFGIRTIKFSPQEGFFLNGRHIAIKGVCNHHDLGPLGAAVNSRAIERQIEILQEMGCNAIRTSHNPPAPELLNLCDKMGMLVMDEAFDCWKKGKRRHDYGELFDKWHKRDLTDMIARDRNHPCVIIWSIGNEVPDQHNAKMAKMLRDIAHSADPTRPAVICSNSGQVGLSSVAQAVDIMGYNYNLGSYGRFYKRKENAETPLIGSETSSCISSRGEYFFPINKNKRSDFQISSYDLDRPGWGCSPDKQFEMLEKFPAVAGEFVWTGFDYIGEPTPYNRDATVLLNFSDPTERQRQKEALEKIGKINVPSRSSYFGIVDLCGFPKDRYYIYQAHWRPELPMAHILPHWNWPERIGKITPVHIYTSGDEAELFLNGVSLGRKKKGEYEYRLRWDDVVYSPGELKVIAYKDGRQWTENSIHTTGEPAALQLTADRAKINADGKDLAFITVKIIDKAGMTVPTADIPVTFSIEGPGEIVATGNGDATDHELFHSQQRKTFNGLALVIIRFTPGKTGTIKLKAGADGLKPAETVIIGSADKL